MPRTSLAPAITLILCATALRIAYHIFLSPFELTGDEAHYWEWSRHLDWSYYSKGPGIAYLIRAATELFGDAEWSIRIVPALSACVMAICMTILARRAAPDSRRAPLFAALAALLLPAFQGAAMLATIDAPFLACWAFAILAFDSLDRALRANRPIALHAFAFGATVGLGILAKYTMLLLLPGLLIFHLIKPPPAPMPTRIRGMCIVLITTSILCAPILIWNAQRGWPTVHHLLGHLKVVGSDVPGDAAQPWRFNHMNPLEFIGSQIAVIGPLLMLILMALSRSLRGGSSAPSFSSIPQSAIHNPQSQNPPNLVPLLLICAGLPILLIYFGVSFFVDAEGNWAFPAYISLGVLASILAARAFESSPQPSPLAGEGPASSPGVRGSSSLPPPFRIPQSPIRNLSLTRFLWNASLIYGLIVAIGIPLLPVLERIPAIESFIPMHRVGGARADAEALADELNLLYPTHTRDALVMADRYGKASLMAYYLHRNLKFDAPLVTSAMSMLGDRPSSYDFWPDTNPRDPSLFGRDAVLIGSGTDKWNRFVLFDSIDKPYPDAPFRVGVGYRGPREPPAPTTP